jgi:hypothetical protein
MNLRSSGRRALRGIERDLARSDRRLNMLFASFTGLVGREKMPSTEKIERKPLRLLARPGRRPDRHRAGDNSRVWPIF